MMQRILLFTTIFLFVSLLVKAQYTVDLAMLADRVAVDDTLDFETEIDADSFSSVYDEVVKNDSLSNYPCNDKYGTWCNLLVNPYTFDCLKMADSAVVDLSSYCPPIPNVRVTSDFGFRRSRFHYGIDLKVQVGDTIRAAFDGMVRISKRGRHYGNVVVIRHYNSLETVYAHLSKILVQPGQQIKAGDVLGFGGNTGRSTGPHLHLEFRYLGQPLNPHDLVDFSTNKVLRDSLLLSKNTFSYVAEIRKIRYHTVRRGETLSHISHRYGVSVSKLRKLNRIGSRNLIRPGQKLRYT